MSDVLRVVVVDDHDFFRSGLRELLSERGGVEVVGEAADGAEAVGLVTECRPDVAVMDLNMPRVSGVEATRRLSASSPEVGVLVLTISEEDRTVIDAICAGASGYVLKDAPVDEIYQAIQAVAAGQLLVSPKVTSALVGAVDDFADRARLSTRLTSTLSERQVEILRLLALGRANTEIAEQLYLSPATVKKQVTEILRKLGVENRVEAAAAAVRAQLV